MKKYMQQGFSFVETILYIGIMSVFLSSLVFLSWDIIFAREKADVQVTLARTMRFASNKISYEIRNATMITTAAGSTLELATSDPARTPVRITVSNGRIMLSYGTGPCSTTPCFLTDERVSITSLSFTDLSSLPHTKNVQFSITGEIEEERQEQTGRLTITSSVELRNP